MTILKFVPQGKIAKDVRSALEKAWANLNPHFPMTRRIRVLLCPAYTVQAPDGGIGFACFMPMPKYALIAVATWPLTRERRGGPVVQSRRDGIRCIVESFCHELGHYEQMRDGKPLTERGIAARTKRLAKLAGVKRPWQ